MNGEIDGPVMRRNCCTFVFDELGGSQDHAAETSALAVDVLGRGIHDAIGAQREGLLKERRREHIVDGQRRTGLMGDVGDRARCR